MRAHASLAALVVVVIPVAASAGPPCGTADHTQERAGNPSCVAKYAVPGRAGRYDVGYIGGGCLGWWKGEARGPAEGVFGWDYVLCGKYPGRVFLNWCHCNKQPGPGPYKTDGPHVPDVFSVHPLQRIA